MSVCYVKLWKLLLEKDIKRTDLISIAGVSSNIVAKALKCDISDIVEFVTEEK